MQNSLYYAFDLSYFCKKEVDERDKYHGKNSEESVEEYSFMSFRSSEIFNCQIKLFEAHV